VGIPYQSIPVETKKGFSAETILKIESFLDRSPDKPILIACQSGNRAAAILALHLAKEEHLSSAQTLERAKELGMTSPELKRKMAQYLALNLK
jgi:protein tyrosine phosphatase (PTP) superfamily phosphohydrolase (DUF442 family)